MLPKPKNERHTNDRYLTRPDFADWAMNVLPVDINPEYVFDPGFGDTGALSLAVLRRWPQARITGMDIRSLSKPRGVDTLLRGNFLTESMFKYCPLCYTKQRRYDLVVCNPPFLLATEFIDASLFLLNPGGRAIFIVRLALLEGDERYDELWTRYAGKALEHVSVCAKRPKFSSFKQADGTAYALMVFRRGFNGAPTISFNHFDKRKAVGFCEYFASTGFARLSS